MLIQKYLITLFIAALAIGYNVGVDLLIGLPWNNFMINWNYSLTDPSEQIAAYLLVLLLVAPDLLHLLSHKSKGNGQNSGKEQASHGGALSTTTDTDSSTALDESGSGLPTGAQSVNQGGNNQGGGQNNVK